MTLRLAINGFGRIGRCVLRALHESGFHDQFTVVAINEPADPETIAYLTRYDSTHGRFRGDVALAANCDLLINGQAIKLLSENNIAALDWGALGIDIVLECSGNYGSRQEAMQHIKAGARQVILSQPGEQDVDITVVYGVNHQDITAKHRIISNASCSTNCVVPVIKVLHDALGVSNGVITTIHSAMNDQPVLDAYHHTDLRKTRAALQSMIPIDTGLARGIDRLLPQLAGCFEAQALRVPTLNVSAIDLSVIVQNDIDAAGVNALLQTAAKGSLQHILGYTEEPLASCDFNHDPRSGIVDASQTRVSGKRLVKVLTWFDNEWGYANRMLDVASHIATLEDY